MPNVLIIDDDPAMREALAEASEDLGFAPRLAASGVAALALLEAESVDAVILDLRMPGMDGLEVLPTPAIAAHPLPPVTVLTAHATAQNTIEAMRLGAFDHLTKPISRSELKRVLDGMAALKIDVAAPSRDEPAAGLVEQSPAVAMFRAFVVMVCPVVIALAALFGTSLPDAIKAMKEGHWRAPRHVAGIGAGQGPHGGGRAGEVRARRGGG